jgi:hypothetical protein
MDSQAQVDFVLAFRAGANLLRRLQFADVV